MADWVPREPFRPLPAFAGPHAQTVAAAFIRRGKVAGLRRERLETADGDFLDIDHLDGRTDAPCVVVLHGLEGSSESGYVQEVLRGAKARGFAAAAINFRSCSGEPNRVLKSYSSGDVTDVSFVVETLRRRGVGTILLVGFSLGGNVALKYVSSLAAEGPVRAAAAIGVPFDLASCARTIDSPGLMRWIYRTAFVRSLKAKALRKARQFPSELDREAIIRAVGISGFDDVVTAKIYGYRDAAEYYADAASLTVLERIRVPTLLVYSEDDPIAPPPRFPPAVHDNPALHFLKTRSGGHVGFVDGTLLRPGYWAEREALRFFDAQAEGRP